MSISMFRFIASLFQTVVASMTAGSLSIIVVLLFGGFVIPKSSMTAWLEWGFWISPLSYGEIGLTVNEFLSPRWEKRHKDEDLLKGQAVKNQKALWDKWQRKAKNISEQVADYMRDPSRMLKQMQLRRSTVSVFGTEPDRENSTKGEEVQADGDPELLDDSEFYTQLRKEFLETNDPKSSGIHEVLETIDATVAAHNLSH